MSDKTKAQLEGELYEALSRRELLMPLTMERGRRVHRVTTTVERVEHDRSAAAELALTWATVATAVLVVLATVATLVVLVLR